MMEDRSRSPGPVAGMGGVPVRQQSPGPHAAYGAAPGYDEGFEGYGGR